MSLALIINEKGDLDVSEITTYDMQRYITDARNGAHSRAMLRKLTLAYRKLYGDKTQDKLASSTALYVFVAGKYRHIFLRRNYVDYVDYKEDRLATWHKIRAVRINGEYHTINVLLDGFPGYRWFYLPKRYYSDNTIRVNPGDLVCLFKEHNTWCVIDYVPTGTLFHTSLMKVFHKE